ncbi:hypothetical protein SAMN05444166_1024 [Singulisphaera sp. GP187]|uniref:hypothetical protein n=1 Tax=Singulisphaera sp. GP187 TaxID=1882752 RepID=UPI00092AF1FC|nr:hypothetical protein [Singulisphaera sp. GP187]SIN81192.1 hypothetical protein SAMN05444166_1024 [Singulisphaera sp. GP187]
MASEISTPRASDLLAVKSRVSWGAIAAGAMVALSIYLMLTMLGIALGIEVAVRHADATPGTGAAIYAIVTLLLTMFFGGWATSRLAVGESKLEAVLYGMILWGVLFMGMAWLLSVGIRAGFGAMVGASSGAYTITRDAAEHGPPAAGLMDALRQRYDAELGGDQFIEDLKKAGVSEDQAKKAQAEFKERVNRLRNDPTSIKDQARELADRPEIREAARRAADSTRRATWWTLLGMVVSMATVIAGSLIGAGELLQPVPILGVRRVSTLRN